MFDHTDGVDPAYARAFQRPEAFHDSSIGIFLDADKLISEARLKHPGNLRAATRWLHDALDEEFTHAAWLQSELPKWLQDKTRGKASGKTFQMWTTERAQQLTLQIRTLRTEAGNGQARREIDEIIEATWGDYREHQTKDKSAEAVIKKLAEDPNEAFKFGTELVRQLVQLRQRGRTTATGWRRVAKVVLGWLEQTLNVLKRAAGFDDRGKLRADKGPVMEGRLGPMLPEMVRATEKKIADARLLLGEARLEEIATRQKKGNSPRQSPRR